jgi:predicted RNase H-like HicB family nuclease
MAGGLIVVEAAYDAEAGVWYVEDSDLPGVNAWAPTVQELGEKLPAVLDLLEEEGDSDPDDVPIAIIAHMSTRARRRRLKDYGKPLRKILAWHEVESPKRDRRRLLCLRNARVRSTARQSRLVRR